MMPDVSYDPTRPDPRIAAATLRARAHSPFLALLLDREPALAARLEAGFIDSTPELPHDIPVARRLRLERRALALTVAVGDLAGVLDLTEVTGALTTFADHALDTAIATAVAERYPGKGSRGFAAIALGKQGSHELNYSSDIDPILLFDPVTIPRRAREEPEEAAVRIGRRVVELLQARDGDGYVLRVDLRLRPSPEVTPIVLPVNAAIGYYESQALPWERAAFIRARAAAGDRALGQGFLDAVRPFVWRRTIDFGALQEIREISRRIRDHYSRGQAFGAGYDLKRGRGGIREVEFFAQIHQLIHGGRDPALRAPATRDALARLAAAGWIDLQAASALSDAYTLLRTIEHRVQMIDDRQTHALPIGDALDRVARLHGAADGRALVAELRPHVEATARTYDALDESERSEVPRDPGGLAGALARFGDVDAAVARITAWRSGTYPALRSTVARQALEAVLPILVPALAEAADPRSALIRLDGLLERLPSALNVLRLLEARPALAQLLAAILSHAAPLADALSRRADLLDGLIDASAFDAVGDVPALAAAMRGGDAGDYQGRLDHVRRVVGDFRFALGAQIVAGAADPLDVAAGYARVAEAATQVLAETAVVDFSRAHVRVPGSEFVILALGRMGGGLMTHASDLDFVYLFTGDFRAESDGPKPLGATLYYNRLAQRVTAALSVPTAAGALYDVDTRLRPSGAQGPLVVSLDSFARYQREDAWTWEHMALTRARPVFGSPEARAALAIVVSEALSMPRADPVADVIAMRNDMATHKPPSGPFDAKLLPGGLVDLEFAVHLRQLAHRIGLNPHVPTAIDALICAGLVPPSLSEAHDLLTRLLVTLRLVAPEGGEPSEATRPVVARALGLPDWPAVLAAFEGTRQDVVRVWQETGR